MGIRFRCHHCEHELHVKDFQAGKKGRCPRCDERILIPAKDAKHSTAVESSAGFRSSKSVVEVGAKVSRSKQAPESISEQNADAAFIGKTQAHVASGITTDPASKPNVASEIESDSKPNVSSFVADSAEVQDENLSPEKQEPAKSSDAAAPPAHAAREEQLQPKAILESGSSTWYVMPPSGGQFGPAPAETMMQWLIERRVTVDSLVWREGWEEWQPAAAVFEDYFDAGGHANGNSFEASLVAAPTEPHGGPSFQGGAIGDKKRSARKQKKRKRYALSVAFLSVITLILIGTLVTVLMMQL